jgi:hypothetical protein
MEQVPALIIHKRIATAKKVTREFLDSKTQTRDFKNQEKALKTKKENWKAKLQSSSSFPLQPCNIFT